ncbi:MAG TPA: hypothetical protein ENN19_15050 [Chloroflexi bacterium]|nr:hypothetical protein [Chloroflexota bacterium]
MTERLYDDDAYCARFCARIVDCSTWEDQPAVVLDRTAFYPLGGGQPADSGSLSGVPVVDVFSRETDDAIVHLLANAPPFGEGAEVEGQVDWDRRFDHMQQHTGQHILSAAFEQVLNAGTVGFHLGSTSVTIDVTVEALTSDAVAPVEALANQVVWENRPVTVSIVSPENVQESALRRLPTVEGPVRLVSIGALSGKKPFDLSPCGGTHVAHTGEIGLIKVIGLESRGEGTRIEFLCGGRAWRDYATKHDVVTQLGHTLTVGYWELDEAVERLQIENKRQRRDLRQARERLLAVEADELAASAVERGPYRVVCKVWEQRSPDELRTLALALTQPQAQPQAQPQPIVTLLAGGGERTHLVFARDANAGELDMNALLQEACAHLDGRGGGRPHLAQGSVRETDLNRIREVLNGFLSF